MSVQLGSTRTAALAGTRLVRSPAKRETYLLAFWLLLPATAGLVVFVFLPILYAFWISFNDYQLLTGATQWAGLKNYVRLLSDQVFALSLWVAFLYALMMVVAQVVGGLGLALLVQDRVRGIGFFRTAYFLPVVASFVVMAAVWKFLYAETGIFNTLLLTVGLPPQPFLRGVDQALPSLALLGLWKFVGFNMLVFLGGLQAIPQDMYEAADIDGAGPVRRFFSITLPLLKRVMLFVVVMTTIEAFKVFTPIYVMTSGGPQDSTNAVVFLVFRTAFRYNEMSYAAAMSFVLLGLVMLLMWAQFRALRTEVEY
ncbi:MAG: sugar ABC transporter permease [Chloroflexi bacterium]|nr:sugar ABC transporter permease [Chloroflexota bacterium]